MKSVFTLALGLLSVGFNIKLYTAEVAIEAGLKAGLFKKNVNMCLNRGHFHLAALKPSRASRQSINPFHSAQRLAIKIFRLSARTFTQQTLGVSPHQTLHSPRL